MAEATSCLVRSTASSLGVCLADFKADDDLSVAYVGPISTAYDMAQLDTRATIVSGDSSTFTDGSRLGP